MLKYLKYLLVFLTIVVFLVSYQMSDQNDHESMDLTTRVMIALTLTTPEEAIAKTPVYASTARVFREVAHVIIFEMLALILYLTVFIFTKRIWISGLFTIIILVPYAFYDEYIHQVMIDGRGIQRLDLILDFIGIVLALLVAIPSTLISKRL